MQKVILYFSRTGCTKYMAETIAKELNVPAFDLATSTPEVVENYDLIILGTPVEGGKPAKETTAFIESLPTTDCKRAIVFCTHRIFKAGTLKTMSKALQSKGYHVVLELSKKNVVIGKTRFADVIAEIKKNI